jgi:hypothetical protein
MLTYSSSIIAASVKVLEKSATPDMQCTFAPGSFKGGQIGSSRRYRASAPAPGRSGPPRAARSRPSRTGPATRRRSTRATSRRNPTGAPSSAVCGWRGDFRRPRAAAVRLKPPAIAEAGYGARVRDLRLFRRVSIALITPPNSEFPILECAETHVRCW